MRRSIMMCLLSCALTAAACSDDKSEPTAGAEVSATAEASVSASHGGSLVAVGAHLAELKFFENGNVEAWVLDAEGKEVAQPQAVKMSLVQAAAEDKNTEDKSAEVKGVADKNTEDKSAEAKSLVDTSTETKNTEAKSAEDKNTEAKSAEDKNTEAKSAEDKNAETKVTMSWSETMQRFTGTADTKLTGGDVVVRLEVDGKVATGTAGNIVLLAGPEFGGVMMVAGQHGVEVAADADGTIEAAVKTAAGAQVEGGLALAAKVKGEGDATHTIKLTYDPLNARFRGKAEAGVKLEPGPIEFLIDGKVVGQMPRLALRAKARHGGHLVVAGDYSVELVAKGGVVSAFVADANALAHAKGDLNLQLQAGSGKLIDLKWHAPSACYRAQFSANLDMQPFRVFIRNGGKLAVGGKVCGKGRAGASVKLTAPSADIKTNAKAAAGARVGISIPKPKVSVKTSTSKSATAGGKAGVTAGGKAGATAGGKAGVSLSIK